MTALKKQNKTTTTKNPLVSCSHGAGNGTVCIAGFTTTIESTILKFLTWGLGHWLGRGRILKLRMGASGWTEIKLRLLNPHITLSLPHKWKCLPQLPYLRRPSFLCLRALIPTCGTLKRCSFSPRPMITTTSYHKTHKEGHSCWASSWDTSTFHDSGGCCLHIQRTTR